MRSENPVSSNDPRTEYRNAQPVVASRTMLDLFKFAKRAAVNDAKVLITGESGVGKDVVARQIHANSKRRLKEFVPVNCAGVTESLLESELFGHVKGSFTGAFRDKVGKLRLAHQGTLFLDEVGEMSLRMQALLLRFLESGEIQSVGSDAARAFVDVRVIAATNRNLTEMVAAGTFREDLLYRLRVIHLHVPPLRERVDDIRPLAMHFFTRAGHLATLTEEAWQLLYRYRWPGNVRELHNVVEQIAWLSSSPDEPIGVDQIPPIVKSAGPSILPVRERRRQVADELYHAILHGGYSFWEHIHPLFLSRDITRHDMRELVRRGLSASGGNYRTLLQLFSIPATDYKRFMNFLSTHDCRADFREFRNLNGGEPHAIRRIALLPPLPAPSNRTSSDANGARESAQPRRL
jgi:transcriptional regulator with PAS, ATPase and Fis domain